MDDLLQAQVRDTSAGTAYAERERSEGRDLAAKGAEEPEQLLVEVNADASIVVVERSPQEDGVALELGDPEQRAVPRHQRRQQAHAAMGRAHL